MSTGAFSRKDARAKRPATRLVVDLHDGALMLFEHAKARRAGKTFADPAMDDDDIGLAQAGCGLRKGVEHLLQVEGRAADHLEHVGGRGLLLQGFGEILGALLQFVEQPRILDGDDGLVGEGLQQLNVMVRERAGLGAGNGDDADRDRAAHHRDANSMLRKPVSRATCLTRASQ